MRHSVAPGLSPIGRRLPQAAVSITYLLHQLVNRLDDAVFDGTILPQRRAAIFEQIGTAFIALFFPHAEREYTRSCRRHNP